MIIICIKYHLNNIWSSIQEKIKQRQGCVEKAALLIKKRVLHVFWYKQPIFWSWGQTL